MPPVWHKSIGGNVNVARQFRRTPRSGAAFTQFAIASRPAGG